MISFSIVESPCALLVRIQQQQFIQQSAREKKVEKEGELLEGGQRVREGGKVEEEGKRRGQKMEEERPKQALIAGRQGRADGEVGQLVECPHR